MLAVTESILALCTVHAGIFSDMHVPIAGTKFCWQEKNVWHGKLECGSLVPWPFTSAFVTCSTSMGGGGEAW